MKLIDVEAIDMKNYLLHENGRLLYSDDFFMGIAYVAERINETPTIDIVHCDECVYCNVQNTKYLYALCERHGIEFKPFEDDTRAHHCSWGIRRPNEND